MSTRTRDSAARQVLGTTEQAVLDDAVVRGEVATPRQANRAGVGVPHWLNAIVRCKTDALVNTDGTLTRKGTDAQDEKRTRG